MKSKNSLSYSIVCSVCGKALPADFWWKCFCGGSTKVVYNKKSNKIQLPLEKTKQVFFDTPLLYLSTLSKMCNFKIFAKLENQNTTGSFKDRGSIVEIQKAKELKKTGIVCASTGNMAVSLSAFAAKRGLNCLDFIPKRTSNIKIDLMRRCGGKTFLVDGPYDECVKLAEKFAKEKNYFLCGDYTLRREGQKSIGWEISKSGIDFDAFIIPVGNGNLGTALYQGFREAKKNTKQLPMFIGVQPSLCNPVVSSFKTGSLIKPQYPKNRTKAAAFDVGKPLDGSAILNLIKKTKGKILDATDKEMVEGQKILAQTEGILGEITVGASIAVLKKLKKLLKNKTVLIIVTGSGLSGN